jgi:anti-sigma regulatory factor (Ser/Thr protein kinase)
MSLGLMYTTLGWRVRSARRALEKELTRTGMSKENAKQLSAVLEELKNNIVDALKRGVFSGFSTRL